MKSRRELDLELVKAVQGGDVHAFETLVRHYKSRLLNYLFWMLRNTGEAEDVAQETFFRAYKGIKRFRGDSQFSTWLFRIGINTAKRSMARSARGVYPKENPHEAGASLQRTVDYDTPESIMESRELLVELDAALDRMQPELRTALLLREFDGLDYEEIADRMFTPIGTVRSRIHRARESLLPLLKNM